MPSIPSGYVLPPEYYAVPGTTIRSNQHNTPLEDLAQGVNDSFARDGSRPATGNLPMNGRKITGLATGTANNDAATVAQANAGTTAASAANARITNLISELTTAMNAACPIGMVAWHNGTLTNIPSGWIVADGNPRNRSSYPELWAWASPSAATDSDWLATAETRAKYSSGNGSTTFRTPDLNGMQAGSLKGLFLRGSGGGVIQITQGDAIRNITGTISEFGFGVISTAVSDPFFTESVSNRASTDGSFNQPRFNIKMDLSRSVPTASENRPVSAIGVWIIRATPFSFAGI